MEAPKREEQSQAFDLETSERLGTTARAVAQGVVHTVKGDYTTQKGAFSLTSLRDKRKRLLKPHFRISSWRCS